MSVSPSTLKKAKAVGDDRILKPALMAGKVSVHAAYLNRNADDQTKKRLVAGEGPPARTIAATDGDWTTPDWILSIGRQVLDQRIDLDPASSTAAQETIKAKRFLTAEDDALKPKTPWGKPDDSRLHVWLHPPTGETASLFAKRFFEELQNGTVGPACWFGPAAFEAPWYQGLLRKSTAFATFREPVRKDTTQSYAIIFFRIKPMQVHEAVGDRGGRQYGVSAIGVRFGSATSEVGAGSVGRGVQVGATSRILRQEAELT